VEERPGSDPSTGSPDASPAPEPAAGSSLFKLRLGATDAAPSLIGGSTGGAPSLPSSLPSAPAPAVMPTTPTTPTAPTAAPVAREEGWEEFPAAVHQDEAREYKSDSDFQSMIEQLASQIAETEGGGSIRPRPSAGPNRDRPAAPAAPIAKPVAPKAPSRGEAKRAAKAEAAAAAPTLAPATPAAITTGQTAVITTGETPAVAADMPEMPEIAEMTEMTVVGPAPIEVDVPERLELPVIVEASPAPAPSLATPPKRVVDRISGSSEHQVIVPRPAAPSLSAPNLLPKIEAKPGAPRPTKPVDFHALLKDSGMAPSAPAKHKRKRHPFRVLFKLVLVLGLIGGGLYYAKLRFLDTKWKGDLEGIAGDVAERRGLEWDHAVDVIELPADQYALRLATTMIGVESAETVAVSAEWRAMGLTEGNVDLVAIGTAATADQPAFYDPTEQAIYAVAGMSPALREVALSRAMTNALVDQHVHWGRLLVSATGVRADVSVRLGVRALFDGDALSIRAQTTEAVLADTSIATAVSDELAGMRLDAAAVARGASPYGVALTSSPGAAARWLFTDALTPDASSRDRAETFDVASDAAVFDGARGRSASVSNPPSQAAPVVAASTTAAPGATAAPATTTPPTVPSTEPPTTVGATTPDGSAVTTTLPTIAAAGASARGMIYWYYVLAGRIDSNVAWDAALRWQGDGTSVESTPSGLCVSSVIVTKDVADRDVLLSALSAWAAAGPAASAATATAMNDTAIQVHSCDPGPTADTLTNELMPRFGNAPIELNVAARLREAGLTPTEVARVCVIETVRQSGAPPMLESSTVDHSLTDPTVNKSSAEVIALVDACSTR